MEYAYSVDNSWRDDIVPNLRLAAEQPWMGLTAYISSKPHLIIGRNGESYIMEDEEGHRIQVDFSFPWEEPKVENNRIVAASRIEDSPFKNAGLLAYDSDTGEWAVRVGISNMRYPLEDHVATLEENGWKLADQNFDESDVIVPVHGKCPNCGSDSLSYAEDEDDDSFGSSGTVDDFTPTAAATDPVVLCHACHQWCRESELDTGADDASDNQHHDDDTSDHDKPEEFKQSAVKFGAVPFSFQGVAVGVGHTVRSLAINADNTPLGHAKSIVDSLQSPHQEEQEYVRNQYQEQGLGDRPYSYDNPFVNRGGSVLKESVIPEQFQGGNFTIVKKWFSPEDYTNAIQHGGVGPFRGIITSQGGMTSHAVVVARGGNMACVITTDDNVDRIQTGDQVEISPNGVVNVNGGDPNFVAQDPSQVKVATAIARFVWAGGVGKFAIIDPQDINKAGTGHMDMLNEHMNEGSAQVDMQTFDHNAVMGYIYDDGKVSEDEKQIPDQPQFEQWVTGVRHQLNLPIGPIERIDTATYVPKMGSVGDKLDEALTCSNCGSHTLESYHIDKEKGKGEFGCLNCGNVFNADYRKHAAGDKPGIVELPKGYPGGAHKPGTRIEMVRPEMKGQKGSIIDHHSEDDIFPGQHFYEVQLDNGTRINGIHETTFKKVKSASVDKTGVVIHTNLPSNGWHLTISGQAKLAGLDGTITYPDGTTLPIVSGNHLIYYAINPAIKAQREQDGHFGNIPVVVDVNDPDKFMEIVNEDATTPHTGSMDKGAPYPKNDDEVDHSAPGHHLPKKVNEIYNAIKREHPEYSKEKAIRIAWERSGLKSEKESRAHPLPEDVLTGVPGGSYGEYEGHPVMCYMCGNERTASLGTQCQHCGYILTVRRDGPGPIKKWAALEPGTWYTMHSPKYKVPDVIHVKEVSDEGVTASIEGDDKGLFPISLSHDEIEQEGYSFERYSPTVDSSTGDHFIETQKTARRDFSATEQKELVNENMSGLARNIHKLNLDGTHYPTNIESANEDPLKSELFWW